MNKVLTAALLLLSSSSFAAAQSSPQATEDATTPMCRPCVGLRAAGPDLLGAWLAGTWKPAGKPVLYAAWDVELTAPAAAADGLRAAGATPWLTLVFRTPAPVGENAAALGAELQAAANVARATGAGVYQIAWRPATPPGAERFAADYAFLLKRAAVAVTGAAARARVATQALPADAAFLRELYGEEIAAYVDVVAIAPSAAQQRDAAVAALAELDPGRAVAVDGEPYPQPAVEAAAIAAEQAAAGIAITLFAAGSESAVDAGPLAAMANDFQGDLSYDSTSTPSGGAGAWAFVRGEDLALRVVARAGPAPLVFADPGIQKVMRLDPATGKEVGLGGKRVDNGVAVQLPEGIDVALLRLERSAPSDLESVQEKVTVSTERGIPVEEILRRLQSFEDAQKRRLTHFQATNATTLRFRIGGTAQAIEATFRGDYFFAEGQGFDWTWKDFLINGVRWRGKTIPELPLVQPERVAAMPLEILLTKEYRYTLRGTETVEGRDAWVVDFAPAGPQADKKLYQGTVWIDRQLFARLRTRAVQLGMEGDVISNEETITYSPVDAGGQPAPWSADSYFLPMKVIGKQLMSLVNTTTLVEKDVLLSDVRINGDDFEAQRSAALASDATMVRDTPQGMRYLVKDETTGERVVKEGFDTQRLFALAGVFYDDSLDYPLPLAGVNYLDLDWRHKQQQLNVFFAGALLNANLADPHIGNSKFDFGLFANLVVVPLADEEFRHGDEVEGERLESQSGVAGVTLGRPWGNFVKTDVAYRLRYDRYDNADETADGFEVPSSTFTHVASLEGKYSRSGYQLNLVGSFHHRQEWDPWGFPGNPDFSRAKQDYERWGASLSKSWYPKPFQRLGAEVGYVGGADLDRFSKYDFGFFGETRVHGYQNNRVRATEAWNTHFSYGFGIGDTFRIDAVGDAAWATDDETGLDNEFLAGAGIAGTFMGPWETLVNLDVGVPVAGPDDGFSVYVVFLKLFH
jgi:hypothetical protein